MKPKKTEQLLKREMIEKKLRPWLSLKQDQKPDSGWIKAIRNALGMTTKQLADRMGIAQPNVMAIEEREVRQTLTIETLEKAARALDCKLVYALIPNEDWVSLKEATVVSKPSYLMPAEKAVLDQSSEPNEWVSVLQQNLRNPR